MKLFSVFKIILQFLAFFSSLKANENQIENSVGIEKSVSQKIYHVPFYFLRHGTTDWNKEMLIDGPQDLSLNLKGRVQVLQSIDILKKHPITCIFSSPLKRCIETAQLVSEALENIPIFIILDLEERRFGDWSKCKEKAQELVETAPDGPGFFQYIKEQIEEILPEDAEKLEEFEERICIGINEALYDSKSYPSYPLIIGHGCVKIACKNAMQIVECVDKPKLFTQPILFTPGAENKSWHLLNLD